MKVVLAFDSFKGCLSAQEVCDEARKAVLSRCPHAQVVCLPMSDGGEGLVSCFLRNGKATSLSVQVHGPLLQMTEATYAISEDGDTAYMEMASACGLTLVPLNQRDPLKATTYGLGEMMKDAIHRGVKYIVLGIGGSATTDGGQGMLEALQGTDLRNITFEVACDVDNPLYGLEGAAYVFGPQKGATPEQVKILDQRLRDFAKMTEEKGYATKDDAFRPGTGAAGGLGYALLTYLHAELKPGIELVLSSMNFDAAIQDATIVITGEGCSDIQTTRGKVPVGVLRHAQKQDVPVALISGQMKDREELLACGFTHLYAMNEEDERPIEILMQPEVAKKNLHRTVFKLLEELA